MWKCQKIRRVFKKNRSIMILIADGGSTKTDWCLMDKNKKQTLFSSECFNPYYITSSNLINSLTASLPAELDRESISEVHFYGAGCSENKYDFMRKALATVFPYAQITIAMDLLAAARTLLGRKEGFAAILGTGTNSCIYDGKKIARNIDSLGFILGDEGSGGYIGKKVINDYIRGYMPPAVNDLFSEYSKMDADQLMNQIYTKPLANKFCAGFCKFVGDNLDKDDYFYEIVQSSFRALFKNIICHYPNYFDFTFNCIGSVGFRFQSILSDVAKEYEMDMGKIIRYPMEGLINYHTE